ncbi:MAG: endo-1,4-beta-xylanase [Cyanobacteria bacterium J06641_5]
MGYRDAIFGLALAIATIAVGSSVRPVLAGGARATNDGLPAPMAAASSPDAEPTLGHLARERGLSIGTAVAVPVLERETVYQETLAREFNTVTAENVMKFEFLQPQRGGFDFTESDRLLAFAADRQMQVRGHTLVWHWALPDWLKEGNWTREEAAAILKHHIEMVVGRYRGNIVAWDVVNEAIADDGTLRDSFWLRSIGPDYIEMAFRWAHAADPEALLFYNDYGGEGLGRKSDAIYALVKSLQAKAIPIHGVGLQMHVRVDSPPAAKDVAANMQRLGELGLQVQITEMDVRIRQPATASHFERQATVYREMLQTCLAADSCNAFVIWGFSDRYSWIPKHFQGWGDALIFDARYQPKPAYKSLWEELATRSERLQKFNPSAHP